MRLARQQRRAPKGVHFTRTAVFLFALFSLVTLPLTAQSQPPRSCYQVFSELMLQRSGGNETARLVKAHGTEVPIARAFEKEGLFYSDISSWFDRLNVEKARPLLERRLDQELNKEKAAALLNWLKNYPTAFGVGAISEKAWEALSPREQLDFLFSHENPFALINKRGKDELFTEGILNFDLLLPSASVPKDLTVGDDEGSYEVKSAHGETDRGTYFQKREEVEKYLGGKVGHQHLVHAWPADAVERERIAPYYIELLDSGTWFLFWRQMKRSPASTESILSHPYLGTYSSGSLRELYAVVVSGDPRHFRNKYKMIGARNVTGSTDVDGQKKGEYYPDFELRSGNKGEKREFMEDLIESRIASGDYRGLKDFRSYPFDSNLPITNLIKPYASPEQMALMEAFSRQYPLLRYSSHPKAFNFYRNKILAPFFAWENRLDLGYKKETLERARKRFAEQLIEIARGYLFALSGIEDRSALINLRAKTQAKLEYACYLFARRVRLDLDFERYLTPRPDELPEIQVPSNGRVDVNAVSLGIEFSFRFPDWANSASAADKQILQAVSNFKDAMGGGTIEVVEKGGHGHGLSIRYRYTDPRQRQWRFEWDGVQRSYVNGEPHWPHGGHLEVPTPKFAPQDMKDIATLYQVMRFTGYVPKRSAGGAHVNIDLAPLFALPEAEGARKLANLIAFFESRRSLIEFLWQHPLRKGAARPVELSPDLVRALNGFESGWKPLGTLLYVHRYLNPYIGRKPAYTQLNVTGIMVPILPEQYLNTIDIKNPEIPWFPAFGGKGVDRIEFRLFDAPTDEYLAALQIKYVRAMLNTAYNGAPRIELKVQYSPEDPQKWRSDTSAFLKDATEHLRELGLEPSEFLPVLAQALENQQMQPRVKPPLSRFEGFLPPKKD